MSKDCLCTSLQYSLVLITYEHTISNMPRPAHWYRLTLNGRCYRLAAALINSCIVPECPGGVRESSPARSADWYNVPGESSRPRGTDTEQSGQVHRRVSGPPLHDLRQWKTAGN